MVARPTDPGKRPRGWTLHTLPADEAMLPETPQAGPAAILEASTDLCGRLLGARYDVKELLSHGERGAVYLAEDRNYGRTVALRLAAPQAALPGSEDVRALARRRMGVRHPHLAAVQGEGLTEGGLHYVAMEHVEGRNLIHMLGDPRLRWPTIQAIGVQVGEALVALHGAWVIHGDVHPGNLVWTEDPERPVCIKLVDLDVGARAADSPYLPAGFYGERDSTCDVYALVASLYELCTGAVPEPTLAALAGHDELPEWFVQLLRTVLRSGSTPSARGLLASLRQGLPTAAVTSVPVARASEPAPQFVAHAPSEPVQQHVPSGPLDMPFMGHAEPGSVQQHAPSGPLFTVPASESGSQQVGSPLDMPFMAPASESGSQQVGSPLFTIDAVQHGSADPQAGGHAASESQQGLFVAPQSVPLPVVHSQSVPVPVVHSPSVASVAAATEDELWFAAVADFDPLQHLETITAETAGRPESATLTGLAFPATPVVAAEPEVVKITDLEPPPPFEAAPEGEAPAMVTMRAVVDPRPSPVLGVPLAPVGPVDLEISVEAEPPQPGALTREYEATAEILVNSRRRSRQVALAIALVAVLLIVWRLFARETVQPVEEEARVVPALDVKSATPAKPAPVTPVAVPSAPVVALPVPEVVPEADATPEVAPAEPAALAELPDPDLDAEPDPEPAPNGAPERLGAGDFRQILLRANRSPATVKCYVQHTAGVEQKVEAVVRVSARGRVQKLKIDGGPLGDCLKQVVERLTFPRAQRSAQHQYVFRSPVQE